MLVGVDTSVLSLPSAVLTFPRMGTSRLYGGPGKGVPAWDSTSMATLLRNNVTPWVSFKDDPAAVLPAWLSAMPTGVKSVWLTWHHEPEGDLDPNSYRYTWQALARIVRRHPNGNRVTLVPIHTLYPARHKIGDRYSGDWTNWVGIFQQWAPTDPVTGRYLGAYMGWDCYLETTATSYEDPASFLRIPVAASHLYGVPLAVPELGAVLLPGDDGTGRAQWITATTDYLRNVGTAAVNWWHALGSAGQDYRLTDAPSRTAWQAAASA